MWLLNILLESDFRFADWRASSKMTSFVFFGNYFIVCESVICVWANLIYIAHNRLLINFGWDDSYYKRENWDEHASKASDLPDHVSKTVNWSWHLEILIVKRKCHLKYLKLINYLLNPIIGNRDGALKVFGDRGIGEPSGSLPILK